MTKKQTLAELVEQMVIADGHVYCPACSTPNWKIYHKPDGCPKGESYADQVTAVVEKAQTVDQVIEQAETRKASGTKYPTNPKENLHAADDL